MSLLGIHEALINKHQKLYGRNISIKFSDIKTIQVQALWNDIGILSAMRGIADVEGQRQTVAISRSDLGEDLLLFREGLSVIGSASDYIPEREFLIEEIKEDNQHNCLICYLKVKNNEAWAGL